MTYTDTQPNFSRLSAQRLSELMDARQQRSAQGTVQKYGERALEMLTQQTQLAIAGLTAPLLSRQLRKKGAE